MLRKAASGRDANRNRSRLHVIEVEVHRTREYLLHRDTSVAVYGNPPVLKSDDHLLAGDLGDGHCDGDGVEGREAKNLRRRTAESHRDA